MIGRFASFFSHSMSGYFILVIHSNHTRHSQPSYWYHTIQKLAGSHFRIFLMVYRQSCWHSTNQSSFFSSNPNHIGIILVLEAGRRSSICIKRHIGILEIILLTSVMGQSSNQLASQRARQPDRRLGGTQSLGRMACQQACRPLGSQPRSDPAPRSRPISQGRAARRGHVYIYIYIYLYLYIYIRSPYV